MPLVRKCLFLYYYIYKCHGGMFTYEKNLGAKSGKNITTAKWEAVNIHNLLDLLLMLCGVDEGYCFSI